MTINIDVAKHTMVRLSAMVYIHQIENGEKRHVPLIMMAEEGIPEQNRENVVKVFHQLWEEGLKCL